MKLFGLLVLSLTLPLAHAAQESDEELPAVCMNELKELPGKRKKGALKKLCQTARQLPRCASVEGRPIFHFDRRSFSKKGKRILALSVVHGDEPASGTVALSWAMRLHNLKPRNAWRVVPIVNPDGFKRKIRMNANGVDLNRNFPTQDWDDLALERWIKKKKKDPRRYPGPHPASEKETRCAVSHFHDFQPDFIISIHTPLGVLDFDGPKMKRPKFSPLPWISLGNFPGSLGRYMWKEKSIPVLTIELKGSSGVAQLAKFDQLQDISGTVAIQAGRKLKKNQKKQKSKKDRKS